MTLPEVTIAGVEVTPLGFHQDRRGWLAEIYRNDEISVRPVMAYVSQTHPGVARGPHEHRDQADVFVFMGPSDFRIYLWDRRPASPTHGQRMRFEAGESQPARVVVPAGVVHAYKNVGTKEGLVINCPDRLYAGPGRREPVDEIRWEDDPEGRFALD
ncbi:MAG TPA: dTDP-4-dehydrorhamnose 3,5-epimerase family protein [Candidatus Krumholzibacteria bacterium]|jgi:dTDP-4-dehydrorhamnose 3,5-epimerase|nr:dTDP-4-dehydrorhamnose 3,5-epimerase family protein [Candidatus Krumholzibacteria bacterium]